MLKSIKKCLNIKTDKIDKTNKQKLKIMKTNFKKIHKLKLNPNVYYKWKRHKSESNKRQVFKKIEKLDFLSPTRKQKTLFF